MTDPAVEQPTAQAPPAKAGGGTVETGVEYMKSVPGILKIVEFVSMFFFCEIESAPPDITVKQLNIEDGYTTKKKIIAKITTGFMEPS